MGVSQILQNAPADRPLAVLHSGRSHARWARWSIVAQPVGVLRHLGGRTCWEVFGGGCAAGPSFAHDPLTDLAWLDERLTRESQPGAPSDESNAPPWRGGWIGYLSFDFGRVIEPHAQCASTSRRSEWPLFEWLWCPRLFIHEADRAAWYRADLSGVVRVDEGEVLRALGIESLKSQRETHGACLDAWQATQPEHEVEAAVARTIEYIRAGDIFQANIARQYRSRLKASPRQLAAAAWRAAPNWYSAYLELAADRQVLSLSPELFLEVDRGGRRIITRPLKGTMKSSAQRSSLESSEKDEAELNMIVDLMRNDLGRLCEFGSVQVTQPRAIESHPTVHHGVATIEGRLRDRVPFKDIVAATFPAGSITGAPKIRAMQIIDELEPFARGPYCGSIGFVGLDHIALNVAIRTMCIRNHEATYAAGAGIVVDSDPAQECREMLAKCAVVQGLAKSDCRELAEALAHG